MAVELVEPIERASLVEPIPGPKRGRGRPPALNPDGTRKHASGSRKRPATRRRAPARARGPRSLREPLAAFLTVVNAVVLMSPLGTRPIAAATDRDVAPTRVGDELDTAEINALAAALDAQAQRSPRFRRYLEKMLAAGTGGQLIAVVGMIVTRRAARHGIAPAMLDPLLGIQLAGGDMEALGAFVPPDREPDSETGEVAPDTDAPEFDFEALG